MGRLFWLLLLLLLFFLLLLLLFLLLVVSVVAVFLLLIAVVVVVGCSGPLLPKIVKLLFKTVVRYYCRISCNICCIRVNSESCWICSPPGQEIDLECHCFSVERTGSKTVSNIGKSKVFSKKWGTGVFFCIKNDPGMLGEFPRNCQRC